MKNSIYGWKDIYRFNVVQNLKSKSMKVVTIILCLMALCCVPVISLINNKDGKKTTDIKTVRVVDLTGMDILSDLEVLKKTGDDPGSIYAAIEYVDAGIDMTKLMGNGRKKDVYSFDEKADYVYMQISYFQDSFQTEIIYSNESKVTKKDAQSYGNFVSAKFRDVIIEKLNLSEEQKKIVDSTMITSFEDNEEEPEPSKPKRIHSMNHYKILYALMFIVLMALSFCGERVAMGIVTEKASKVMEYLLTSVKPMAIVVGKVLSAITVLLFQIMAILICFLISILINSMVILGEKKPVLPGYLDSLFSFANFSGMNVGNILVALLILIGGFLLYGMIAALAGASVSKLEEITEGVKMYSLILLISAYICLFTLTSFQYEKDSIFRLIILLVPVTSIFFTPGMLLTGYIKTPVGLASLVILVAALAFLTRFVADVYESMVYYNGAPMKLKDIINISKQKKAGAVKSKTAGDQTEKDGEQ